MDTLFVDLTSNQAFKSEVENALADLAEKWATRRTQESVRWPGWNRILDALDLERLVDATSRKSPRLDFDAIWDESDLLERAVKTVLPEHKAKKLFEDVVREVLDNEQESMSRSRNPDLYHGVRNRNFLAQGENMNHQAAGLLGESTYTQLVRLASQHSELRQHIVPLLRMAGSYEEYVQKKKNKKEQPLSKDDWENRVKGKGEAAQKPKSQHPVPKDMYDYIGGPAKAVQKALDNGEPVKKEDAQKLKSLMENSLQDEKSGKASIPASIKKHYKSMLKFVNEVLEGK